jgi:hypothetical protein
LQEHWEDRSAEDLALNSKMKQLQAQMQMQHSVEDAKKFSQQEHEAAAQAAKSLYDTIKDEVTHATRN